MLGAFPIRLVSIAELLIQATGLSATLAFLIAAIIGLAIAVAWHSAPG